MTYKELYDKALWDLEHNNMTLGEFEEVTEPLNKEIPKEEQTDGDLISRQAVIEGLARIAKAKAKSDAQKALMGRSMYFVENLPSAEKADGDLVSKSVLDQIKWERDVAISQLHDLGYELGEKPRVDGDLINRQSVIGIVEFECGEWKGLAKTIAKAIEQLPSAEKTAEWIKQKSGDELFPEEIVCSKCYHSNSHLDFDEHNNPIGKVFLKSKYCPNCGAKMEESEKGE